MTRMTDDTDIYPCPHCGYPITNSVHRHNCDGTWPPVSDRMARADLDLWRELRDKRAALAVVHKLIGWAAEGPISTCVGWHSHPILGIEGHMHQDNEVPHTHRPIVAWDMEPSSIANRSPD